jgi:sensitive to high expression protein 9, mitochondrial
LQRKHAWTPQDLERFTSLYRSDHVNEQTEAQASEALATAESVAEEANSKLSRSMLARYHEEQIWSDKIRRMSTWGTWGLMGVNIMLFVVFQIGVEPWRRRRLVSGFEEKVREALKREEAAGTVFAGGSLAARNMSAGAEIVEGQSSMPEQQIKVIETTLPAEMVAIEKPLVHVSEDVLAAVDSIEPEPATIIKPERSLRNFNVPLHARLLFNWVKAGFMDLISSRQVTRSKLDITTIALESAAAGAAFVGIVGMAFFRVSRVS